MDMSRPLEAGLATTAVKVSVGRTKDGVTFRLPVVERAHARCVHHNKGGILGIAPAVAMEDMPTVRVASYKRRHKFEGSCGLIGHNFSTPCSEQRKRSSQPSASLASIARQSR